MQNSNFLLATKMHVATEMQIVHVQHCLPEKSSENRLTLIAGGFWLVSVRVQAFTEEEEDNSKPIPKKNKPLLKSLRNYFRCNLSHLFLVNVQGGPK